MSTFIEECAHFICGSDKNWDIAKNHADLLTSDGISVVFRADITSADIPGNAVMLLLPGSDDPLVIAPNSIWDTL